MENKKVTIKDRIIDTAKSMPKPLWIAAVILPGGFTAIAAYLTVKCAYETLRTEKKNG